MNDPTKNTSTGKDDLDEIGKLVRIAGERELASNDRVANAHARVSAHWQTVLDGNSKARQQARFRNLVMAASVVAALGTGFFLFNQPNEVTNSRLVAIERVSGEVFVNGKLASKNELVAQDAVIETSQGGLIAFRLPNGHSARLAENSRAIIESNTQINLSAGAVYMDSGPLATGAQVSIATPYGVATDIGTQFQVRVDDGQLSVAVREGMVELARADEDSLEIDSGQLLEVSANGNTSGRQLASNDQIWHWINRVTPPFEIEGVSLEDYLIWYTREVGLRLQWASTPSQNIAKTTRLSGSITNLSLDDGLDLVRRIAPFESRASDSVLFVEID